jgi:hypothetical protein
MTAKKLYRNCRQHVDIWLSKQGKSGARSKPYFVAFPLVWKVLWSCFLLYRPPLVAEAAEEEPEDVESIKGEELEVVDLNDFGKVGQVSKVGEVEMVEIPPPKKASVKASSGAAQKVMPRIRWGTSTFDSRSICCQV